MAQVVEVEVGQAGTHERLTKSMLEPTDPASLGIREYEIQFRGRGVVAKEVDDGRVHWDVPSLAILRILYDDEARIEVQIVPVKATNFAGAHAGMESNGDNCLKVRCDTRFHQ